VRRRRPDLQGRVNGNLELEFPAAVTPRQTPVWIAIYRKHVWHRAAKNYQPDLFAQRRARRVFGGDEYFGALELRGRRSGGAAEERWQHLAGIAAHRPTAGIAGASGNWSCRKRQGSPPRSPLDILQSGRLT